MADATKSPTARLEMEGEINWATSVRRAELDLSAAELARGVELDAMASRLLGNRRSGLFRELAVLPRELDEEEEVLDLAYARLFFRGGLLVLTDRRLVFVNHRIVLPGMAVKRFRVDSIRDHRLVQVKDFGQLALRSHARG